MLLKAICILALLLFNASYLNLSSCVCSKMNQSITAETLNDAGDICSDCGHNKSCCAEKQDQEFGGAFGEEISLLEIPDIKVTHSFKNYDLAAKRQPELLYLNKAPPDNLVSLHQKLLV